MDCCLRNSAFACSSNSLRRQIFSNLCRYVSYSVTGKTSIFGDVKRSEKTKKLHLIQDGHYKPRDEEAERNMLVFDYAAHKSSSRVFMWGTACFGALGVPRFVTGIKKSDAVIRNSSNKPTRCMSIESSNCKQIACGSGFTLFVVRKQKGVQLLGTGVNTDGQLGYTTGRNGKEIDVIIRPTIIDIDGGDEDKRSQSSTNSRRTLVKKVSAGRAHSLVLFENGNIIGFGNNAYGQLGRPCLKDENFRFSSRQPSKLPISDILNGEDEDVKAVDITCGQDHSIVRTNDGRLFSCGWSSDGQCGQGKHEKSATLSQVRGDVLGSKIVKVATSADTTLALSDDGEVFGWGNAEYRQFAMASTKERRIDDLQQICTPVHLPLQKFISCNSSYHNSSKIIDIACGGSMCMILTDKRECYVWGFGILGKGPNLEHSTTPQLIPNTLFGHNEIQNEDVYPTKIFAGIHSQAAINNLGHLYTWGKNRGDCLGLGFINANNQYFPLKVSMLNTVADVSIGVDHMGALAKPI